MAGPRTPHVGFVMEQTLGHVSHAMNLEACVSVAGRLDATFLPVPFPVEGLATRLPGYGNWTVRAGVRARRLVRAAHRARPLETLYVHTQVPAVLLGRWMRRIPTVVSLDATPEQYDLFGAHYAHDVGPRAAEAWKHRANARCFARAAALVTWSEWAARGLVEGYGVGRERIEVIPPGVRVEQWARPTGQGDGSADVVRILFVGGDFARKGGDDLLAAFAKVRARVGPAVELHVVTAGTVPRAPGVVGHGAMAPNSVALRSLFHRCDLFCLPTRGDCLPMVLAEAGAAGLPSVATDVGAIREIVVPGETGLVVAPGDVDALARALELLVEHRELRERTGRGAQALVAAHHDAAANAARLMDLLVRVADTRNP